MRSEDEIVAMMNEAQDATYKATKIRGSYEQGVIAALEWVVDTESTSPLVSDDDDA